MPDTDLLQKQLDGREALVLDGATGTELQRRGVPLPLPLWTGDVASRAPDVLLQVHVDYLQAGADIVTANTFRTQPYTFRAIGHPEEAISMTHRSVAIARQACRIAGHGWVAGSMAPLEDCYHPERVPENHVLWREHALHAGNLKAAGVDLILVETMNSIREAHAAAESALETGLPVLVSLTLDPGSRGALLSGEPLSSAWEFLRGLETAGRRIRGFLVNCSPPPVLLDALHRMQWPGESRPIGAYANAGHVSDRTGEWNADSSITPEVYAAWALDCRALGARLIGGCCGTTPDHIRATAIALHAQP